MSDDRELTGREKLLFVAQQVADFRPGKPFVIACPYCYGETLRGDTFCCATLCNAVATVLEANDQLQVAETMDRILERHLRN